MSSLYNIEPQPTAKCIIHTTAGSILLELFGAQTPLTTRNFLQHCLDGYYNNTVFHRLIPGFILQGGDPTGTGSGGESIYDGGRPFADEFHSRLRFNRRGLLGMANAGQKDDNGSQFFLTLGKTEELNGRHTMFGRVVGDTIYNLVKMGETELVEGADSERPMFPTRITSTEVLLNPFEDMTARPRAEKRTADDDRPAIKKRKKKGGKQMLSFGVEEDGEDGSAAAVPIKAAKKFNPKLVSAGDDPIIPPPATAKPTKGPTKARTPSPTPTTSAPAPIRRSSISPSPSPTPSPPPATISAFTPLETTTAQLASLKSSLRRTAPTSTLSNSAPRKTKSALEAMIPTNSTRGRKRGTVGAASTSQSVLASFEAFKKRLEDTPASVVVETREEADQDGGVAMSEDGGAPATISNGTTHRPAHAQTKDEATQPSPTPDIEAEVEAEACDLHFVPNCQSCRRWDEAERSEALERSHDPAHHARTSLHDADTDASSLLSHRLTFAKDRLGKDLEWKRQNERELVVIDPREREREIKEKKRRGKRDGGGGKEGAASRGR